MTDHEAHELGVKAAQANERSLDAMYPNNQLGEQVRDLSDCYSMGQLLQETFFTAKA